jgi:alanine racemase
LTIHAQAEIDLSALRYNFSLLRGKAGGSAQVLAMVKANAYGHGALRVAAALPEADFFGVATLGEALALRQSGIEQPIVVMKGFFDADELKQMCAHDVIAVVHQASQIALLQTQQLARPISVFLKLNSGMNRLGFLPAEAFAHYAALAACQTVSQPPRVMTHLSEAADRQADERTTAQVEHFFAVCDSLNSELSLSNSAAIMRPELKQDDIVRPGGLLYGISPFSGQSSRSLGLRSVMHFSADIIALHACQARERIGYGGWLCPTDMRIAVVSAGYGDGYPLQHAEQPSVWVRDTLCPVVGAVSMDMLTIDVSQLETVALGDRVTLWGGALPVEQVAAWMGTHPYELLCRMTDRVVLAYRDDGVIDS